MGLFTRTRDRNRAVAHEILAQRVEALTQHIGHTALEDMGSGEKIIEAEFVKILVNNPPKMLPAVMMLTSRRILWAVDTGANLYTLPVESTHLSGTWLMDAEADSL